MSIKDMLLLQTTHKLTESLGNGFSLEARERTIVWYTDDREMKLEIEFLLPRRHFVEKLKVFPRVQICSKAMKKWWKKENLPEPTDVFFYSGLENISARTPPLEWVISGEAQDKSIVEMGGHIRHYVLPFFEKLIDTDSAVELICERGWAISNGLKIDSYYPPIDFALYYGSNEHAGRLFQMCIKQNTLWAEQVAKRYKELDAKKGQTVEQIFKSGDKWINLSYICGFRP